MIDLAHPMVVSIVGLILTVLIGLAGAWARSVRQDIKDFTKVVSDINDKMTGFLVQATELKKVELHQLNQDGRLDKLEGAVFAPYRKE